MDRPVKLESVLASPRIPTLPAVAAQVLALSRDTNVRLSDLAEIIQNDQALATKVIRTVNSAYYGLTKPCSTIRNAIALLGLNTVRVLALSFTLVDSIDGGKDETDISFDYLSYWRRALYSAVCARRLARMTGHADPEEAFLAALVQDVGMVALYHALGERYLQAIDLAGPDHRELVKIEQRAFALSHDVVGEQLAERWRLPRQHIAAVRYSHHPQLAPFDFRPMAGLIYTSTLVAMLIAGGEQSGLLKEVTGVLQDWYAIETDHAVVLLRDISNDAVELARVLEVNARERGDVNRLLDEAEEALTLIQCELAASADHAAGAALDRRAFNRAVEEAFEKAGHSGNALAILFAALDGIDELNEREGHVLGDRAITYLDRFLRTMAPADAVLSRYVGAQFAMLLPGAGSSRALSEAQRLQRELASMDPLPAQIAPLAQATGGLTLSVGVASCRPGEASSDNWIELLRGAAGALHAAKQAGRGEIRCYTRPRATGSSQAA